MVNKPVLAPRKELSRGGRRRRSIASAMALAVVGALALGGAAPAVAADPTPTVPVCDAGYVYGIKATGQIRQVAPGGSSVTDLGSSAQSNGEFNGLGIGSGGSPVYAYNRSNSSQTATIWTYNTTTGTWATTGQSVNSTAGNRDVTFVAGGVSLQDGAYYFGGFQSDGKLFRIWKYTGSGAPVYKGSLNTSSGAGGATNGDLAFNAAGDLFVVRGSGNTTTVFSVTAANLAAANGGTIPTSGTPASFPTISDVNGVAFDSTGKAFLGTSSNMTSYDMPAWTNGAPVTTNLGGSTDLATCSSPPTISLQKTIDGARVAPGDQFTLTLKQGGTTIGTATTTGNAGGLQQEQVGPVPTVRGVPLSFTETAAGTTNLGNYITSWQCLVDGVQKQTGSGTSGTFTIPATGSVVTCGFTNSPLIATVSIHKDVADVNGQNATPRAGWQVGAVAAPPNVVTATPSATTQSTDTSGNASWSLKFGNTTDAATVTVSEQMQSGYQFLSGTCVISKPNGDSRTVTLTGPSSTDLSGVVAGDSVACAYTNKVSPSTLTLQKSVGFGSASASAWNLTATGPAGSLPGPSGATGTPGATNVQVTVGVPYALSENSPLPTYVQNGSWTCTATDAAGAQSPLPVVNGAVTVPTAGLTVVCGVVNATAQLTLLKQVDGDTWAQPSDWTLTAAPGPNGFSFPTLSAPGNGSAVPSGSGQNTWEVRPGQPYGLAESVPNGSTLAYLLDRIELSADGGNTWTTVTDVSAVSVPVGQHYFYRFVNKPAPAFALPLTGGVASDWFLIGGGLLTLLALGLAIWHRQRQRKSA